MQEVANRFWQVALFAEPHQAGGRVTALGDLRPVGVAQQRHVSVLRFGETEPAVQQEVFRGGADPLLATHHRRDPHQMVVDDHGHVICGETIGLQDHLVVGEGGLHLTTDDVGESQRRVVGHEHPHHRGLGESGKLRALLAGLPETKPVVAGPGRLCGVLFLAQLRETFRGTPAVVGVSIGDQLLDERPVGVEPLRLPVRSKIAALQRPLIGRKP